MKLGEALTLRSDLVSRLGEVRNRISSNVLVQDQERPAEDPNALIEEHGNLCDELESLVTKINLTNSQTRLPSGETLTEALVKRDVFAQRLNGLRQAAQAADVTHARRYSLSEIKMVPTIKVADLNEEIDGLAKQRRQLDTAIQAHNWTTDLVE
jgi:hypothetical protein